MVQLMFVSSRMKAAGNLECVLYGTVCQVYSGAEGALGGSPC